jgi:hypothetical protein
MASSARWYALDFYSAELSFLEKKAWGCQVF